MSDTCELFVQVGLLRQVFQTQEAGQFWSLTLTEE